jgi:hypothetical protein
MKKIIMAIFISVCLISTAYSVEYSANVIAGTEKFSVEIDCPSEVQKKSEFMVNVTITNLAAENATDVIVELTPPKKDFSYGPPKKRIGDMESNTQIMVSWDVKAKRPGTYNITVIATGETETTGEIISAQDQATIVVKPDGYPSLIDIIDTIRSFFRIGF